PLTSRLLCAFAATAPSAMYLPSLHDALPILMAVRTALFTALGVWMDFPGGVPWGRLGLFTGISWAVSMMLYALQQGLSLRFANQDRKSTRLNSSHVSISYAVFCLKQKKHSYT